MSATKVQKWGNSMALRIPAPTLRSWGIAEGQPVSLTVEGSALVIRPVQHRYTLAELLAECDPAMPLDAVEREWLNEGSVGLEES
jgi:antitoxin ChpS